MSIKVREFNENDIQAANEIWNEVVEDGVAFPQEECLTEKSGLEFFKSQSYTGIAYDEETGDIVGLYILHPNNVGRCGHICNASYAVKSTQRGKQIGEILVTDCLKKQRKSVTVYFNLMPLSQLINMHLNYIKTRLCTTRRNT